jgi:ribonuclease P protein component
MSLADAKRLKFPSSKRLSKQKDFDNVFRKGKRFAGSCMVMWVASASHNITRVGVIASKKIFRKAVERSRVRRVLREIFRLNLPEMKSGVDIVLFPRQQILQKKYREIEADFLNTAEIAGLLKKKL